MIILVINSGSSSLKYQVIDMTNESLLCKGIAERIGIENAFIKHQKGDVEKVFDFEMKDHTAAFNHVLEVITDPEVGVIKSKDEIGAIGHRVLHGGEKYACSILVDDDVMKAIEDCIPLGPLHNPANLMGIRACMELMPGKPNVAVFDTAFHQTMSEARYMYPLPYEYYEKYHVRKYGFHGTSHRFVSKAAAEYLGRDPKGLKIVSCHLGSGASICAIEDGKCVDTSMGLTPLQGIMMCTRCGDIDPAAVTFIESKEGLTPQQMDTIMNKKSGMLGVCGYSDARDVTAEIAKGNKKAVLAFDMYVDRIKNYIGAYAAKMNGIDVLLFTAGVGENHAGLRSMICKDLEFFGIKLDEEKNKVRGTVDISAADSRVKILVIPTNEELMIARDTYEIITK